jgi:putative transposase
VNENVTIGSAEAAVVGGSGEVEQAAVRRVTQLLSPEAIDSLVADADEAGLGTEGLLNQLTKAVLERALDVEMADHLGYDKGDPAGVGSGNSRNGRSAKTVLTHAGPVELDVPRDRSGSFEPQIVRKRQRRLGNIDDMILSLYARGMTTRDIIEHLSEVYDASVSPGLVSQVTDVVNDEIVAWQTRPVDAVYPILYIDAIVVKIREGGSVDNRAAHLVIGVDVDGFKHVLGCWIADVEGAKFWQNVLNELVNRGLKDALIVCCDGLTGLPDAINNVWPQAIVQTCVIHLIRALVGISVMSPTHVQFGASAVKSRFTRSSNGTAFLSARVVFFRRFFDRATSPCRFIESATVFSLTVHPASRRSA